MTKVPVFNKSKKQVGLYDSKDKTYYRIIGKHQMFLHPKYQGMCAVSRDIFRQLVKLECKWFCFTLTEWEKEPFDAIISVEKFNELREDLAFGGKNKENCDLQFGCRLQHFTRRYSRQKILTNEI